MKRILLLMALIIAWLIGTVDSVTAQNNPAPTDTREESRAFDLSTCKNIQAAIRNYLKALRSDNDGVVESALFYAALLKRDVPGECFSCLKREIDKLVTTGPTTEIRYKSYLVSIAYENPKLLRQSTAQINTPDELFVSISDALRATMFGDAVIEAQYVP